MGGHNQSELLQFLLALFASKPAEKVNEWHQILADEEYDTIDSLKAASDEAWSQLKLPLAIKDQIRAQFKATPVPSPSPSPAPVPVPAAGPAMIVSQPQENDRLADQIDVVVFDISSSMNARSFDPDPERTRINIAKIFFHTMMDKLYSHELSHALGLVCFGRKFYRMEPVTQIEEFQNVLGRYTANEGSTSLYDAIDLAKDMILAYTKTNGHRLAPNCVRRIFCLTDGDDNSSVQTHWEVAKSLQEHNMVLDAFPLADFNVKLQSMAAATGGETLACNDLVAGMALFESEPLLHVASRAPRTEPLPEIKGAHSLLALENPRLAVTEIRVAPAKQVSGPVMSAASAMQASQSSGSSASHKRIMKEYVDITNHPPPGCVGASMSEGDPSFWQVWIAGPPGTPYEGGMFALSFNFPSDYPFKPPKVNFQTRVYHCNINSNGAICLDVLKDQWSPALTASRITASLLSLLTDPNPMDPLDAIKGQLYRDNKAAYEASAREWTAKYAT